MRAREFLKELAAAPPGSTPGEEGQDIGKLTATITDLQKQIGELQKAALQQAEEPPKPAVAAPAVTAPTTTQGTVGTTTQPQTQQPATQVKPGTPMGQQPPAGQAQIPPEKIQQKTPPSVSQPSTMTNMKIKQQLAQSQAGGTK
jgi:hypothetical protein